MENNNEKPKQNFSWPRIGSVANSSSGNGRVNAKFQFCVYGWGEMIQIVEGILLRGNAARVVNVAGQFKVTELVIQ